MPIKLQVRQMREKIHMYPGISWQKSWTLRIEKFRGTWKVQLVEDLTLAQVMISWFVGLGHASGSVLTDWSLEPASNSMSPSLSAPPPPSLMRLLSLKNKWMLKNKKKSLSASRKKEQVT